MLSMVKTQHKQLSKVTKLTIYEPLLRRITLSISVMHPEDVCHHARR
jgi:hypothetical protein